jgi:uncharacterized protein
MNRPRASLDPRRLDVRPFAEAGAALEGELPQRSLTRLVESLLPLPGDGEPAAVRWRATGEVRPVAGGPPQVWLRLRAETEVALECQRCLQPMRQSLTVDRAFRFAADEDEAARLDEELDDDVLVLSRAFDLPALVEDELILALPIVPRHEDCPQPLPLPAAAPDADDAAPNPFAALAALRRPQEPS